MNCLPWQQEQWERLCSYQEKGRLPHAILLEGPRSTGKQTFARAFANYMLCSSPRNNEPCGSCHGCQLLKAGNHPDFVDMEPEEGGKTIKVDEIRAFVTSTALTPQIAACRITLISPAEAMNSAAANSLLKTLEEPNPGNHILLVSHAPWELPATIRSRCQHLMFPLPAKQEAIEWLTAQQPDDEWPGLLDCVRGAPLKALEFQQQHGLDSYREEKRRFAALLSGKANLVEVGMAWSKDETGMIANWIYHWTLDLARANESGIMQMHDRELADWLKDLIPQLDSVKLFSVLDKLSSLQQGIRSRNLNVQMQFETLALELMEAGT
ncbi:DNA polymerase III subunit delta' [Solemya velum gill symbiont]|uniref:DNA polymerase III subunit delta' n=1 Tax=Solemya velum gill symbiont TaxID=2340 RepID=UPI00099778C9|nr:DNA polymerase III subunit delta' [Solemya velum gill symbiont]OOZ45504.1 DNA polymerase III subunit delta' [Solemya velum gill symbiont]OOZ46512.1 DNA polymerase III subunit delta' [Solemya velum gill symbiont]OOZ49479.1 DNA polymerase III subunit delta' [Solemya velum gill symbiont]OOZ51959.1 DNA polymerase III subunit delta' [Solemya velum gill symbiont]OOZ54604.1 DNA polymerase III subunit delta' [Solemya velum gill symbiont]